MASDKIILLVRVEISPEKEEEFNRWYDQEHIPALLKVPGVLSARRGRLLEGKTQNYIAVYEHSNEKVRQTDEYKKAVNTEWTQKIRPFFRSLEVQIYKAI